MIALSLDEVARLCEGELYAAPGAREVTGVQIDSRRVQHGDLFVAVGRGAEFLQDARDRGAGATLVPADAHAALGALGLEVRSRSRARVVGITGSTGKTSTKDILAALCRPHARTVAAEASYNAELGVPLTLCRLEHDTEICIVELAMRGPGQIAQLCSIARPDIGVITGIGPAHLELLGSLEAIARAKAELIHGLPRNGVAIVPAGVPDLERYLPSYLDTRRFGEGADASVESFERANGHARVRFDVRGAEIELELNFSARHHTWNTAAALLAYEALGLPLADAQRGAIQIEFSRWRGEELALPGGGVLINDAWNANPVSMRAALDDLVERAGGRRRIAVLGDMAELGPSAADYHREIGSHASTVGVDALVAVGPLARHYLEGQLEIPVQRWVETVAEAAAVVEELVQPGDYVLVKASRAVGLESLVDALTATVAA